MQSIDREIKDKIVWGIWKGGFFLFLFSFCLNHFIHYWDKEGRGRSLSMEEEEARKEARELYKKWALLEEVSWRQKSREIWLKEGDRNTKFFHKMANAHRRRNQLNRIKVNRRCLTEESEIKEKVGRNFQELLTDPGDWKPNIDGLNFERLEVGDVERLEKPFSEENKNIKARILLNQITKLRS